MVDQAKAAHKSLEQERNILQAVMNGAKNSHLAYLDRDFNFVRVNEAYARTCGYTPEAMIGKNHFALYPHAENEAIFARVRDTGEAVEFHDTPFEFPDQPERGVTYWDWTLTPAKDAQGKVTGLILSLFETTLRKRAEEALRQSEARFKFLIESIPHLVWSAQPDGSIDYCNTRGLEYLGKTKEQLQGWSWLSVLHPEDVERTKRAWQEAFTSGAEYRVEYRLQRAADGQYRWHYAHALPLRDAQGQIQHWFGTCTDIHDRKEAEAAIRSMAQFPQEDPNPVLRVDGEGRVIYANTPARDLLGAMNWQSSAPLPEPLLGAVCHVLAKGAKREMEFECAHERIFSFVLAPSTTEGHINLYGRDITQRKRVEEALTQAKESLSQHAENLEKTVQDRTAKLRDSVGELEHFSYTLTHDLRAPLRAMSAFAELMLTGDCGACASCESRNFLQRILAAAKRMDGIITDALTYSRAARAELVLAPVDVGALLREVIQTYPNLQPADITLEGPFPLTLGNEAGLTQCFSNLLGNAIKFVAAGTQPRVRVWASNQNGRVRLWFEDNGIGISPRDQEKLFEMFYRASKDYEGTGVGLALVRKTVEKMGGKVGVESEPGKGSRFWLELSAFSYSSTTRYG